MVNGDKLVRGSELVDIADRRPEGAGKPENCTMHGIERGQINKCKQIEHVLCIVFDPRFT